MIMDVTRWQKKLSISPNLLAVPELKVIVFVCATPTDRASIPKILALQRRGKDCVGHDA